MLDEHDRRNHSWWQEHARLHPSTQMYRRYIERLRAGHDPLNDIERTEVGDVSGKALLHLQCHIGTDSLGWALRGATVTGVDFSEAALDEARKLSPRAALRWLHHAP